MAGQTSKAQQIANALIAQIESGQLPPGARLPSIRVAAQSHGVSKNTATDAYDRLVATGYISPRRGSGFYVQSAAPSQPLPLTGHVSEAIDLVSLLREQLNQHYKVRAGDGRLPTAWMESSEMARYLKHSTSSSDDSDDFEYGRPQGLLVLREDISRALTDRAILANPDQILMTFGANHALDLIVRHFVQPNDTVLVETPGYYPMFGKLKLQKAQVVGIDRLSDGPDLDMLEMMVRQHRPKLFFVQPMAHNPTGTSMSLQKMHRLLTLAEKYDLVIIEDDPFADILPTGTPHLASLDALNRVIYIGTFSKTLSASLRCGYIAANAALIASLTDIKMLTVVSTSGTTERLVHEMIVRGRYRRHLKRLRDRVANASTDALAALREIGFDNIEPSTGGYYLWCPLPQGVDSIELAHTAAREGIFLAPSSLFELSENRRPSALRINIAHANNHILLNFLQRVLARAR
ncbi:aminotransferase-like domain-containing protein [Marinobacter zhejiangensis]|uniref:DNA-binding transcriptional regulator, MocR family, contains an aminotransferase domain n=1 Tax=Marinobacter zhejiangensis TaxID=488535 RepID=A0A1I4LVE8_9GAMM|nr:PLP-dependent aminotransferase family protein [Marinobacter zhejiangensis]SFL94796.1 DNA-binding transcriptional regulator, MocR family, contains an aminotransferase domain [Marinobacter zhejiangensis]